MIDSKEKKKLYEFGKRFIELSGKLTIGTNVLTPLNYSEEKEQFFKSSTYNPQFIYSKNDTSGLHKEVQSLLNELSEISLPNNIKFYLRGALEALSTDIDLVDTIGTDSFSEITEDIFKYDSINTKSFIEETASITFNEPGDCKIQSAEEMAYNFNKYINDLGLEYIVKLDHFNDHIIRVGAKELIIGAKVRRYCNNVNRLVVHEIESHILQRLNIRNSENPILKIIPRADMSLWGEGLAVYNEIQSGSITKSAFETYYYRLKAVEKINYSFREIFEELSDYVKPEKAYMITYRVKRGMGDTGQSGGFTKDASYLMGYRKVADYVAKGGDIKFLYISKFPQIGELLQEYDMLEPGELLLPAYLKKEKKNYHQVQSAHATL